VYTVKDKELFVTDVSSQNEMNDLIGKVKRAWVDCCDLDDKETMIMSGLLGVEATTLDGIENGKVRPSYAKCRDEECPYYTWLSTPVVEFADELKLHPLSIILKERFLITLRSGYSSRLIESTLRTFRALPPEERKPSVTLGKLLSEIIDENSRAMVSIRELIDKIEEEALEKPRKKAVTRSVFKLKRGLSTLHQLLWAEKELLSDMNLGVIPHLKLAAEAKLIVEDAMDDVTRELEFVNSYNMSLDSVLRLQDLGLIHRVERSLVFLTTALVILTVILILLQIDIIGLLFG
jgi:Mg2+ and Co2+ transporter CorA